MSSPHPDLRSFLRRLRADGDLVVVDTPVDARLEVAEIHRRVIAAGGPALHARVLEVTQKGLLIQRYKGLGEMNPEQLAETTMNPDRRTLLQVKVEDEYEADDALSRLMGEEVEPRREFIERHALDVRNLDV